MKERTLLDYWLVVYERRAIIFLVTVVSIVSALLIGQWVTPTYEARASFYIPAKLPPVSYVASGSTATLVREQGSPIDKETAYKPYIGILKSVQLAQIVHAQYPMKSVSKLLRSDVDFEVSDELVVTVYARDHDPKLAANVANAYIAGLNKILSDSSQAQIEQEPNYIKAALGGIDRELRKARHDLENFEASHHLVNLDLELVALSTKKTTLQNKADDLLVRIAAVEAQKLALGQEFTLEGQNFASSEIAITSPVIEGLRTQLAESLTRLSELGVELGGKNLQLMAQRKREQELQQRLSDEIKRWVSSRIKPGSSKLERLRQQLIDVAVEEQRLKAEREANLKSIDRLNSRLRTYPEIKARGALLNANVERYKKMQEQLQLSLTEAQLQTKRTMHLLVPLDHAKPPGRPVFPIWWLNALIALFAGILAGIGYAFFLNYLEETRDVRATRLVRAILHRGHAEMT